MLERVERGCGQTRFPICLPAGALGFTVLQYYYPQNRMPPHCEPLPAPELTHIQHQHMDASLSTINHQHGILVLQPCFS